MMPSQVHRAANMKQKRVEAWGHNTERGAVAPVRFNLEGSE